jgi:hypothetical protein
MYLELLIEKESNHLELKSNLKNKNAALRKISGTVKLF